MKKRFILLSLLGIGGVVALATQYIATPKALGIYDNVQFIQSTPKQSAYNCPQEAAAAKAKQGMLINSSGQPSDQ